MKIYDELVWRGLIKDVSSPEIEEKLNNGGLTFYIGTDPTGDSLHIGQFSSFLISKRLKDAGHNPILLVGGATGLIGDPKPDTERPMITKEQVQHNFDCLKAQAQKIFGFEVVNNYDWSKDLNFIDFLRDYGKYFNVNYMLNKDIVKRRLDLGITYTEFSYMIMQAMDFYWLHENKNCQLQVAGQDQWGNITAGIELIRKKTGKEAYGFTMPLLTKSDGTKFGKTNGKAIWLDREKTSPYEFFQYWRNVDDADVIKCLKMLTFLPLSEIEKMANWEGSQLNEAKEILAYELTALVHGKEEAEKAKESARSVFGAGDASNMPTATVDDDCFKDGEVDLITLLVAGGLCQTRSDARRNIEQGGVTVNGEKETDFKKTYTKDNFGDGIVIKRGKKNFKKLVL